MLKQAKVKVVVSPKAISDISWIKKSNRHLGKVPCSQILLDLSEGHIRVVPIPADKLEDTTSKTADGTNPCVPQGGSGSDSSNKNGTNRPVAEDHSGYNSSNVNGTNPHSANRGNIDENSNIDCEGDDSSDVDAGGDEESNVEDDDSNDDTI
jgi:hypothetical protein